MHAEWHGDHDEEGHFPVDPYHDDGKGDDL